jgi:hypothetical protein
VHGDCIAKSTHSNSSATAALPLSDAAIARRGHAARLDAHQARAHPHARAAKGADAARGCLTQVMGAPLPATYRTPMDGGA